MFVLNSTILFSLLSFALHISNVSDRNISQITLKMWICSWKHKLLGTRLS